MRWKATFVLLAVAVLIGLSDSKDEVIDIDGFDDGRVVSASGDGPSSHDDTEVNASGYGPDDEDLAEAGSAGMYEDDTTPAPRPTTKHPTARPTPPTVHTDDEDFIEEGSTDDSSDEDRHEVEIELTSCQQLRKSASKTSHSYIPQCTTNGEYERLQCRGRDSCWCATPSGKVINGTVTDAQNPPDCEDGLNLMPCTNMVVKAHWNPHLGSFMPRCTDIGLFQRIQCREAYCWCVDTRGVELRGTKVSMIEHRDGPNCDESARTTITSSKKPYDPGYHLPDDEDEDSEEEPETEYVHTTEHPYKFNQDSGEQELEMDTGAQKEKTPTRIMEQPGILAGIIGGAVVGLLCAILLVMFIVYRKKKKVPTATLR